MARGELSVCVGRPGKPGRDELARLAGDFDVMAERIEALVTHSRRVLQDLSHELRSPLARLQLALDLTQSSKPKEAAPYFAQAEREVAGLDQMLGQMLALSRMESGLPGAEQQCVDLNAVVQGCVFRAQLEAVARQMVLRFERCDAVTVVGNAALPERAIDNLLPNALKFSPPGASSMSLCALLDRKLTSRYGITVRACRGRNCRSRFGRSSAASTPSRPKVTVWASRSCNAWCGRTAAPPARATPAGAALRSA